MEVEKYKMIYKIEKDRYLKILGKNFVKNNINKGKLIINNKKYALNDFIIINDFKNDKIKIKIILSKNIYNKSYMFKNSRTLLQFSIIKDLDRVENTENLDDDVFVEYEEENLFDLFLFNKKDDSSLYDAENFFFADLPSISEDREKNTDNSTILYFNQNIPFEDNYTALKGMFENCSLLSSLPNISDFILEILLI